MVQYELDGNTFFITNKAYPNANLAQWGTDNGRNMGTYDGHPNFDQLWILREDPNIKGYYTINNFEHVGSRVAKWGAGDGDTGNFDEKPPNPASFGNDDVQQQKQQQQADELWKFDPYGSEENHYTITNYAYPKAKMAKWGVGDGDWGSYEGGFSTDQVWRLVDRFDAKLRTQEIISFANNAPTSIKQTRTYTTGVTVNETFSATNSNSLEMSLKTSAGASEDGMSASVEAGLTSTISQSLSKSSSVTSTWSEEVTTEYDIPPYTNYVVTQNVMDYAGKVAGDNVQVMITTPMDIKTTPIPH